MQPGRDFVLALESLRARLKQSGVERTAGLLDAMGDDCSYYRKSLNLFMERDFDDILPLLEEALNEFRKIKG